MAIAANRDTPRDRFWLHRSTWLVLLVAAAALFVIIVPGEVLEYRPDEIIGVGDGLTMEHGWPWVWLRRTVEWQPLRGGPPAGLPHHGIPWLQKAAWSFNGRLERPTLSVFEQRKPGLWIGFLFVNVLAAASILVLLTTWLEWRQRRRQLWQFSLAEFLGLTLLICIALGWWIRNQAVREAEEQALPLLAKRGHQVDYRGPRLLRRMVGIDLLQPFHRIVEVFIEPPNQAALSQIVERFPAVQGIYLRSLRVAGSELAAIAGLSDLRLLELQKSQITDAELAPLRSLTSLQSLNLSANLDVTNVGIQPIAKLTALQRLDLGGTSIDNRAVPVIAQLDRLEVLNVSTTDIDNAGLRELAKLPRLEELDLSATRVDDVGLSELAKLKNLRGLGLSDTWITSAGLGSIAGLNQLEWLVLSRTEIDDDGLHHLAKLTRLKQIRLNGTRVTKAGIDRLGETLPDCIIGWK